MNSGQWYHSIELAPGLVTPGWFDLREQAASILPSDLGGKRCLDVGTFDGFWALEMEKRGGEVTAIDVLDPLQWDWPAGANDETIEAIDGRKRAGVGFELAAEALGSSVKRHELSVYDLDPAEIGKFDFIFTGSILLHLRDPVLALTRIRDVCDGLVLVCDAIDLPLTRLYRSRPIATLDGKGRPWWWRANLAGLERMIEAAGLRRVSMPTIIRLNPGPAYIRPPVSRDTLRSRASREQISHSRFGDPHGVITAQPTPGDMGASTRIGL